jgi:hypothetical protein
MEKTGGWYMMIYRSEEGISIPYRMLYKYSQ